MNGKGKGQREENLMTWKGKSEEDGVINDQGHHTKNEKTSVS